MDVGRAFFGSLFVISILAFFAIFLFQLEGYYYSIPLHISLFSLSLFFIWDHDVPTTLKKLGIPGNLKTNVIYIVAGFAALIGSLLLLFGIITLFGIENDTDAVADVIKSLPWFIPLLAIVAAPVTEELFFRALLIPRIGILPSSVLFSLSHCAYGSVIEVAGVFLAALVFSFMYKGSKSIIPPTAVHFAYNLVSIMFTMGWL